MEMAKTRALQYVCVHFVVLLTIGHCDVIVQTEDGPIRGVITDMARGFHGIPYAAPPVGDLRWKAPQKPKPWAPTVYNATTLNPGCPQKTCTESYPPDLCPATTDESCLFLNIWTPLSATNTSRLAVMVYIHGGDFLQLSGVSPLFDGSYFVMKGNVVMVNIDYRLGVLGFLYTGDGADDARGNFGLLDQRLALQWVQKNIANFGGDPNKVTLFGQSAGAQSTAHHAISEKSKGLFSNAIMESSPFAIPYKTKPEGTELGHLVAKAMGCADRDLTCMRSKSVAAVEDAQFKARFDLASRKLLEFFEPIGPVVDGDEVLMQPMEAAMKGLFRKMPMIMGTVSEESRIFIYVVSPNALHKLEYESAVLGIDPRESRDILQQYPAPDNTSDCRDTLSQLVTDLLFTCPTGNVSRNVVLDNNTDVYRYVFNHAFSYKAWGPRFAFCENHVCHGEEIGFLFHTFTPNVTISADEEKLSERLSTYFTNFAKTSDPNTGTGPVEQNWPKLSPSEPKLMLFQTPKDSLIPSYQKQHCDFWDSIGYNQ